MQKNELNLIYCSVSNQTNFNIPQKSSKKIYISQKQPVKGLSSLLHIHNTTLEAQKGIIG